LQFIPFEPSLAEEAVAAFNHATADVPHCYPITPQAFAAACASTVGDYGFGPIRSQETLLVRNAGRVVGLATYGQCRRDADSPEKATIRMLWYERGERRAGVALLSLVEERLRAHGSEQIVAFDANFRFRGYGLGHANLTDRWDHVHGLLGMSGYVRDGGEVFLDWPDYGSQDPGRCPVLADIRVERSQEGGARPKVAVLAHQAGERIGLCSNRCAGQYAADTRAQDWTFTTWVWVEESLQGRGLGRYLLLRTLAEAKCDGYKHAAISTEWKNHRAILFYSNMGYRAVDWTSLYIKGAGNGSS
jgi:GNAT superfamily N-acetyltransferase